MTANHIKRSLCLGALAPLAFGLARCGSESPPVTQPPSPPPMPPPLQPEAIEVALGTSGEKVTLMTKEGGGFTLNGEDFTGGSVMADNGSTYTLALTDGAWTAAFQPAEVVIALGNSGESITLMTTEGGGFTLNGNPFTGGQVTADNGNVYMLALSNGTWMARYQPMTVMVMLGRNGGSVTVTKAEDGGWTLGGARFLSGGRQTARNGNEYVLTLAAGAWTAEYQPVTMPIRGTGLIVTSLEDGTGYQVGTARLPKSGIGDVTVDSRIYHVYGGKTGCWPARASTWRSTATRSTARRG